MLILFFSFFFFFRNKENPGMEVVGKTYDKKFVSKMSSSLVRGSVEGSDRVHGLITIKLADVLRKYKKPLLGGSRKQ